MRLLITAFDPFHGAQENNSWKLLEALRSQKLVSSDFLILPTQFGKSFEALASEVDQKKYTHVLSFGEGDERYRLEQRAENLDHSEKPDNANVIKNQQVILAGKETWIDFSWKRNSKPLPAPWVFSDSCGNFVCNHLSFRASHYALEKNLQFQFLHIPNHRVERETQKLVENFKLLMPFLF